MSEIQQAVQSAKGLAKEFRSVLIVVETLEHLGNLEFALAKIDEDIKEAQQGRVVAVDQRLGAEGLLKKTLKRLDNAGVDLAAVLSSAERVTSEAEIKATEIKGAAAAKASDIAEVSENRKRNAQRAHEIAMERFSVLEQAALGRLEIINKELAEFRERIGSK